MKLASYIVIVLTILSAISTKRHRHTRSHMRNGDKTPVYSMVISAKHYTNEKEVKDFFFAVPFSFNSQMKKNDLLETIDVDFTTASSDKAHMKVVSDAAVTMNLKKKWQDVILLSKDNTQLILHYSPDPAKYTVERIKTYQNQTFQDIQIKFVKISGKNATKQKKSALYVTFDFEKKNDKDNHFAKFVDFWKAKYPKAIIVGAQKQSKKLAGPKRY